MAALAGSRERYVYVGNVCHDREKLCHGCAVCDPDSYDFTPLSPPAAHAGPRSYNPFDDVDLETDSIAPAEVPVEVGVAEAVAEEAAVVVEYPRGIFPVRPVAVRLPFVAPRVDHGSTAVAAVEDDMGGVRGALKRMVLGCCGGTEVVADWERDTQFRNAVSVEMSVSRASGAIPLPQAIAEAVGMGVDAPDHAVREVPSFAASVVVALRMKLGQGAMQRTPDNLALVRREIPRILRDYGVRHADAAAHFTVIERAFFDDRTHGRTASWHARAMRRNRFLRWFLKEEEPSHDW